MCGPSLSQLIRKALIAATVILGVVGKPAASQDLAQIDRRPRFLHETAAGQARVEVDLNSIPVLQRRISLRGEERTLGDLLAAIAKQAGLKLVYSADLLPADRVMQFRADSITVAAALTEVLIGAGVDVVFYSATQAGLVKRASARVQTGTIVGRVTDAKTGAGLSGAEVYLERARWRTATDSSGHYRLEADTGTYTLAVRRLGYSKQSRPVTVQNGRTDTVNVALAPAATRLAELVTTATGRRRRIDIANDVTTINADSVMQAAPIKNLTDLLEGRVPGLMVQHTSGAPGDPSRLRLRGTSSPLRSNDPIVIVDGIRVYAEQSAARGQNLANQGIASELGSNELAAYAKPSPIDYIDPNSIETIQVFKGPSAATLYGQDAANGVIVITTKKGKPGPTLWSAAASHGRSTIPGDFPTLFFAWGHPIGLSGLVPCPLINPNTSPCQFDSLTSGQILNNPALTMLGPAHRNDLSLTAAGGSSALTYRVTGSYAEELGLFRLPTYEAERYQTLIGREPPDWAQRPHHLTSWGATSTFQARLGEGAILSLNASLTRTIQRRSSLEQSLQALMTSYFDPHTGTYWTGTANGFLAGNSGLPTDGSPLGFYYTRVTADATALTNAITLQWDPPRWRWLSMTANVGINVNQQADEILRPKGAPGPMRIDPTGIDTTSFLAIGQGRSVMSTLNLGGIALLPLGRGFQFRFATGLNYAGTSIGDQNLQTQNLADGTQLLGSTLTGGHRDVTDDATFGWYLEPGVGNSKLNFTSGLRLDGGSSYGSATLPKFPKLGFSYLVSDEPWFPFKNLVQAFRTRISYGRAGRQPGPADRLRLYGAPLNLWNSTSFATGVFLQNLGNTELRPERATELEGGFDADVLDGRLSVSFSAYRKTTDDAILDIPVPPSVYGGGVTIKKNIGLIRNTGMELTVGAALLRSGPLKWLANLEISQNRNLVVKLGPGVQPFYTEANFESGETTPNSGTRVAAGYPLFGHWSRPVLGYADANGNGRLELSEILLGDTTVYTGQTEPNYIANLSSTVSLWGLTVNALFLYTDGQAQVDGPWRYMSTFSRGRNDPTASLAEQAVAAPYGTLTDFYNVQTVSTFRFNTLSVRYAAPEPIARWLRAQTLSIAVAGTNLGLWTNYRGMDPNVNAFSTGNSVRDGGQLPQPRRWLLQVNATY